MKTSTNLLGWLLLCSFFLINFTANAQDYPYPGDLSPIYNGNTVDCGLLQNPDQKNKPIWFKVNGNIVGQQPHNKLHNPGNSGKTGSYVPAGSYVDVNFNVNKNQTNRYTLVSYSIAPDGTRTIFDYQSNLYNGTMPVQGNSNQQLVLTPTNCPFEIYFVKGCLVSSFSASGTQDLTFGPQGNPYGYNGAVQKSSADNLILGYTFGDAKPNTVCEICPVVVNGTNDQVAVQLIEVIDLPGTNPPATGEKELIFSVINLNGTDVAPLSQQLIGDVIFSGITPSHHPRSNTPYAFRSDYQLGSVLTNYTVPAGSPNPVFGPKDAFVFDQRNNHNILAYDTYQSEIFRFKVSYDEYNRLSGPNPSPAPEVCIELSPKHPEPHQTLVPIYCFGLDFDCDEDCPATTDVCFAENCDYRIDLIQVLGVPDPITGSFMAYLPAFEITSDGDQNIASVTFTTTGTTAVNPDFEDLDLAPENIFSINPAAGLLTYNNPVPAWNQPGITAFFYEVAASSVATVDANGAITLLPGSNVTVTITNTSGETFSHTFAIATDDPTLVSECQIIPLPVELMSFTGKLSGEDIALNWKTATEENNDRFEIERSADGRTFEKIGTVKGSGNSTNELEYGFLDKDPSNGINYYRLNQVDTDGKSSHSSIIKVNTNDRGKGAVVQLVPNPCNGESCTVHLKGFTSTNKLTVELRDLTGRLVFSKQISGDQASFELPRITTGNGVYILSARDGSHTTYQKVVIQ